MIVKCIQCVRQHSTFCGLVVHVVGGAMVIYGVFYEFWIGACGACLAGASADLLFADPLTETENSQQADAP